MHNFRQEPAGVTACRLCESCEHLPDAEKAIWEGPDTKECNKVFSFQINGCNLHCWYCYVDDINKSGNPHYGKYVSPEDVLFHFLVESRKGQFFTDPNRKVNTLRISGGDPFIVPEIIPWMMEAVEKYDLQNYIYLWIESNLSTGSLYWKYLNEEQREKIRNYKNVGFMGCYKGFDEQTYFENTGASPEFFKEQFKMHRRLIDEGLDVYTYLYPVTSFSENIKERMCSFMNRLQEEVSPLAPLRLTTPYIKVYSPTGTRLSEEREKALKNQHLAMEAWKEELRQRFGNEVEKMPHEIPVR